MEGLFKASHHARVLLADWDKGLERCYLIRPEGVKFQLDEGDCDCIVTLFSGNEELASKQFTARLRLPGFPEFIEKQSTSFFQRVRRVVSAKVPDSPSPPAMRYGSKNPFGDPW